MRKKLLVLIFAFAFSSIFAEKKLISDYTQEKIDDFLNLRISLRDEGNDAALKALEEGRADALSNLRENAVDFEQEERILESFYYMEIFDRYANDSNRKEMRAKMKEHMEKNFALIDSLKDDKISKWMYLVSGDVTAYYMTRSVSATFFYGLRVKGFYEKAIKKDPTMPQANVSLGNWLFYAPGPFGSMKKAERCYKNAVKGSYLPGEKFLSYEFLSQFYFEKKNQSLCEENLEKARQTGIGLKELEKVVSLNKRGISLYQYNRNKSGIDTEMTEDEKDEADKK